MPKSPATKNKKSEQARNKVKDSGHTSTSKDPSPSRNIQTVGPSASSQAPTTTKVEASTKHNNKYLQAPREWPTWPAKDTMPYTHPAIATYNATQTLGLGPIDRWQEETSCQGPWNNLSETMYYDYTNNVDCDDSKMDEEDGTDAGTWWPMKQRDGV